MIFKDCRNKEKILEILNQKPGMFIYHIGDLDNFYFPDTQWWICEQEKETILLYQDKRSPVILAIKATDHPLWICNLELIHSFPDQCYAHINEDYIPFFKRYYDLESHGTFNKMILTNPNKLPCKDHPQIRNLIKEDIPLLRNFYSQHYPDNWFNERMIDSHQFYGFFEDKQLLSVSGIHVYSEEFRVCAIGSVSTDQNHRGKGLANLTMSVQCHKLLETCDIIGLNVRNDNHSAIRLYQNLGFEIIGEYEEFVMIKKEQ